MRSLAPALLCSLLFAPAACSNGTPPAATPMTVTLPGDGGVETTASGVAADDPTPASPDGGPDFYSCNIDSDCVAVAKASCCPNGFLEAVNKQSTDAYKNAFACEKRRRLCPQFRILDKRQAVCGNESHRCEMIRPDRIVCNGTGPNPHSCPSGLQCDSTGHCAATSP
jgi:hypothetical protein